MAEILHQLIGSLSHYLHGFLHPRWLAGFLPSTVVLLREDDINVQGGDWLPHRKYIEPPAEISHTNCTLDTLLGQWLNFKLFGITYLVDKPFKLFFSDLKVSIYFPKTPSFGVCIRQKNLGV